MSELDDLKASVATLTTAVNDIIAELKSVADTLAAMKGKGIDPAAVEEASKSIAAMAANLETATSGAKTETGV